MEDVSSKIKVSRISYSTDRGGWELLFDVLGETDLFEYGQKINLTWRPAFGSSFGEVRRAFNGYVINRRFSFNATKSMASYKARTSDAFLEHGWVQGINFAYITGDVRDTYHQWDDVLSGGYMTMGKIVRHLMGYFEHWACRDFPAGDEWIAHTNMVYHSIRNPDGWIRFGNFTVDPWSIGNLKGSMRVNRYVVEESSNLWNSIRRIADNEFFTTGFTKDDVMHYRRHPMFADTLPDPVVTITADMLIGEPRVTYLDTQGLSRVILHAVTDLGETMHAYYPAVGDTERPGRVIEVSYIRCNDQSMLSAWASYKYLYEMRDVDVDIVLPGLSGLLFEGLDRVVFTYTGTTANGVHIDWVEKPFWIHNITVVPNDNGSGHTELSLKAENRP